MKSVFTESEEDFNFYKEKVKSTSNSKLKRYIKQEEGKDPSYYYYKKHWRTYQMSDHNLLWARIKTNSSLNYLKKIVESK